MGREADCRIILEEKERAYPISTELIFAFLEHVKDLAFEINDVSDAFTVSDTHRRD